MTKKVLMAALVLTSLAFLPSCDFKPKADSENLEKVTIAQWGSEKYLIYLPVYIAQEEGFFQKYGLDVSLTYSGNDDQVFAQVLRGDAQFGVGDPIFTAVSRQQGADGVVVASVVDKVALWGVSKEPALTEMDFSNKKIGTFPSPSTAYTLLNDTLAAPSISNAKIVQIPIGNELSVLEAGRADIVMMLEPAASIAEDNGYFVVSSFPQIWGEFLFTGLTSTEEILNENPGLDTKMRSALQDAANLAHDDRARAIEIAQSLFPTLSDEVVSSAVIRMLDDETLPKDVSIKSEAWLRSIEVRQRVGDVNKGFQCIECIEY